MRIGEYGIHYQNILATDLSQFVFLHRWSILLSTNLLVLLVYRRYGVGYLVQADHKYQTA